MNQQHKGTNRQVGVWCVQTGGLLPQHKGSDGTSKFSYYNTDPDRPSTKKVATSGRRFHEKQNTETTSILRECYHPCIIRLEDAIDTNYPALRGGEGDTICRNTWKTQTFHYKSLFSRCSSERAPLGIRHDQTD